MPYGPIVEPIVEHKPMAEGFQGVQIYLHNSLTWHALELPFQAGTNGPGKKHTVRLGHDKLKSKLPCFSWSVCPVSRSRLGVC